MIFRATIVLWFGFNADTWKCVFAVWYSLDTQYVAVVSVHFIFLTWITLASNQLTLEHKPEVLWCAVNSLLKSSIRNIISPSHVRVSATNNVRTLYLKLLEVGDDKLKKFEL